MDVKAKTENRWTFYPVWIEGKDAAGMLEEALLRAPAIALEKGWQIHSPEVDLFELAEKLETVILDEDGGIRKKMLDDFRPGNVSLLAMDKDEKRLKEAIYLFMVNFDYHYCLVKILAGKMWALLVTYQHQRLAPLDFVELYDRAIIRALGEESVQSVVSELGRNLALRMQGKLGLHEGQLMLEAYAEFLGLLFPGDDEFKRCCLEARLALKAALNRTHEEQNRAFRRSLNEEDLRQASELLEKIRSAEDRKIK